MKFKLHADDTSIMIFNNLRCSIHQNNVQNTVDSTIIFQISKAKRKLQYICMIMLFF